MRRALLSALLAALPALAGCAGSGPGEPAGGLALALACPDPCVQDHAIPGLWEPHGAGDPNDPGHMVVAFRSARANGIETMVTRDGGATWQDGLIPVGPDAANPVLRQYTHSGDAVVAIAQDGTVLVAALGLNNTYTGSPADEQYTLYAARELYVARSHDGGLTFPDAVEVASAAGQNLEVAATGSGATVSWDSQDKDWLAAGPGGKVLVAWTTIRSTEPAATRDIPTLGDRGSYEFDVKAATSSDGGATFTPPALLEGDVTFAATSAAIGPDGAMAIAYGNLFGGDLVAYTSPDGKAWSRHEVGPTLGQPILRPGGAAGAFELAYPAAAGGAVPVVRASTDGGASWGPGAGLDGSIGGAFAHVAFDRAPDGTALLAWYAERADGALDYKVRGRLANGTWTPPLVLAEGLHGPSRANGDYVAALSAFDGGGLVAWVAIDEDGSRAMMTARLAWAPQR